MSLGLLRALDEIGVRVGFFKPISQSIHNKQDPQGRDAGNVPVADRLVENYRTGHELRHLVHKLVILDTSHPPID